MASIHISISGDYRHSNFVECNAKNEKYEDEYSKKSYSFDEHNYTGKCTECDQLQQYLDRIKDDLKNCTHYGNIFLDIHEGEITNLIKTCYAKCTSAASRAIENVKLSSEIQPSEKKKEKELNTGELNQEVKDLQKQKDEEPLNNAVETEEEIETTDNIMSSSSMKENILKEPLSTSVDSSNTQLCNVECSLSLPSNYTHQSNTDLTLQVNNIDGCPPKSNLANSQDVCGKTDEIQGNAFHTFVIRNSDGVSFHDQTTNFAYLDH
ncbi:hypothetical protein PGO_001920 [Plasmodium gonderi]|uniref:Variable surface protein n=1 Tax=Plasmodium gonderi TaxID=77519 RepID=A0A1Y1JSX6_PLAGO|nr:hypothetical protein PGO_001920 [Plasmodium gonderi]GAW84247.1 hypothetical protein PGO_001920 [Plasmodium gonderi]